LGSLAVRVEERDDGVRGIDREAVLALVPDLDEPLRADVPHLTLRAVGEIQGRRRDAVERHAVRIAGETRGALDEERVDLLQMLLADVVHGVLRRSMTLVSSRSPAPPSSCQAGEDAPSGRVEAPRARM